MDDPCSTEALSPRHIGIDAWPSGVVLQAMWESQLAAVAAVGPALPAIERAAVACLPLLATGGTLGYVGAGSSARAAAQDAAELPPTFGWPEQRLVVLVAGGSAALQRSVEGAEDDADAARAAIEAARLGAGDVIVGVAASGRTPFTVAAMVRAAELGALTIGLAGVAESALLRAVSHPILVATGAEPVAGSTRMKAGTAQKIVLNLFSTLVMIRLGHVHDGMMVDMQARNDKLRSRARAMVMRLAACDADAADAALGRTGGHVKRAALVARGLDPEGADAALARGRGSLRLALSELMR